MDNANGRTLELLIEDLKQNREDLRKLQESIPDLAVDVAVTGKELNRITALIDRILANNDKTTELLNGLRLESAKFSEDIKHIAEKQNDMVKAMNAHTQFLQKLVEKKQAGEKQEREVYVNQTAQMQQAKIKLKAERQTAILQWIAAIGVFISAIVTGIWLAK